MPAFLDILIIAALVLFTVLGAHRGFVLTLCSLLAVVVALVGANAAADALAPKFADALQPRLEVSIQESLEERALAAGSPGGLPVSEALAVLRDKGGVYQWAADKLEGALDAGLTETAAQVAAAAASAVAEQIARGLIFLLAFFVVLLAWTVLSHALDLVAKLPGLSSLNRSLGGAMGLVKGLILVYLAVWALYPLTGFVSQETAQSTRLFLFLAQHSPLDLLLLV